MRLSGNTILVTGGNAGIGRGLAERFHALGNQVIVAGRRQAALDAVASRCPGMRTLLVDQADGADIARAATEVLRAFPALDVLVNNAGIQRIENLHAGRLEDAEAQIATNLLGPIRLTAALMPHLLRQERAAIVNVTSALGFMPQAVTPTYSATKAAMHAYTLSLRYQLKHTGIEVLEIVPPKVQTGLQGAGGFDPQAMPLDAFVDGVIDILRTDPTGHEVVVERASAFRHADREGAFDTIFGRLNDTLAARHGNPPG